MNPEAWFLDTAVVTGFYGLLVGMLVPTLIARIPEPVADPSLEIGAELPHEVRGDPAAEVEPHAVVPEAGNGIPAPSAPEIKVPYDEIARTRGLRWKTSLATGVVGALVGARIGWEPQLSFLLYLAPVSVALAVIDWRTRLLPTKLVAPSYLAVIALAAFSASTAGDWSLLADAAWGWLVAGGTFFVLWFIYPRGMGYGDVRLSGVLGIALGYLGWGELLTGVYAGFLLGGVGGLLLSTLRIVDRKAYPFGPFMLVGALVGVLTGPYVAAWYA
jgi:leader peptidase (prepilin peptidase)/N-methyltransferase